VGFVDAVHLAQPRVSRVLDAPMPGHFAIRLGRRLPWTPAVIFLPCPMVEPEPYGLDAPEPKDWCWALDRAPNPLRGQIGERTVETGTMILKIWQGGHAITPTQYAYLMARRAWARRYSPESYHARPVDLAVLHNREVL
jgi:hypothetical protein